MKEKISNNIQIKNKRATFDYELLDTFTAGIVLTGTEIKSIRLGKASLVDTFCIVEKGELWVKNMYIAEYFTVRTIITTHGGTGNYFLPKRNYERSRVRFVLVVLRSFPLVCLSMRKDWRK